MITLENELIRVIICPQFGARITSFCLKSRNFELVAQSSDRQADARRLIIEKDRMNFFEPYAFGMDDAFPSVDEECVNWNGRSLRYPSHGEIWQNLFEVKKCERDSIELRWYSEAFDYVYEKTMSLCQNTLVIKYLIINNGIDELPCIWTWHGLVQYEQDMNLIMPCGVTRYRNVLNGTMLGDEGKLYEVQNNFYDFNKMPDPSICNMVKYYCDEPVSKGHCGIYYPSNNVSYILDYDAQKLPYLGVWITAGGLQGEYNCALEPSNGYYDSIGRAYENKKLPILRQGESFNFELRITLKEV